MTTSITEEQVAMEILQLLYKRQIDNPNFPSVDRAIIQDVLKLSKEQMDTNILVLQEKNLITLTIGADSKWIFAKITNEGINAIENRTLIEKECISSDSDQLIDVFKQARDEIRLTSLNNSEKEKIEKQLFSLKKEIDKGSKTDIQKIQKICNELNKRGYKISPSISRVVLETIKKALNL